METQGQMFTPQPIGFVNSPYKDTAAIPKGFGAKHEAEGILRILPEFELGLTDIEGFSHLMVIWAFDRSHGFDLLGTPPSDKWPSGRAFSMSRSLMSIPFFLHQGLCFCCCSLRCTLLSTGFLFAL